jgi:hypothetical protein
MAYVYPSTSHSALGVDNSPNLCYRAYRLRERGYGHGPQVLSIWLTGKLLPELRLGIYLHSHTPPVMGWRRTTVVRP